jgi:8-oxo-dGTP diphosphatase
MAGDDTMQPGVDYIGVGVGAVILDDEGRLFLARRGPEARNERGLWEFPGGAVEYGETLEEALQREMAEEFGIRVRIGELLDVVNLVLADDEQHWISPTFLCQIASGTPEIREPGKCVDIGWFLPSEMPEDLSRFTSRNLEDYRNYLGGTSEK